MGIAVLTFAELFVPLQGLASRWMPVQRTAHLHTPAAHRAPSLNASNDAVLRAHPPIAVPASPSPAARPLRVVRVNDGRRQDPHSAARVVISGRMADVCAELDRLAALEAAREAVPLVH